MASDGNWTDDVKRWFYTGSQASTARANSVDSVNVNLDELGYEAAYPALQAVNWPDAPTTGFDELR